MALFIIWLNSIASFVSFYIPLFYCFLYLFSFLPLTTCTAIEMEENKVKRSIKELIKKGDKKSASISINDPGSSSFPLISPNLFPSLLSSFPLSPCPLISILIFFDSKEYISKRDGTIKKGERTYLYLPSHSQLCWHATSTTIMYLPLPSFSTPSCFHTISSSPLLLLLGCLFYFVLLCFVMFCFVLFFIYSLLYKLI